MAILGPSDGPTVLKIDSNPIKAEVLSHFGHPTIQVELEETHLEMLLRTAGDFMAGYFPFEERIAVFYTQPLVTEYPLPCDAYWIKQVKWDPSVTRIGDIFGAESFLFNIGNITGIQNLLLDYHLLQAYRKFSQRILATEGRWEVKGNNKIRLIPVPRGTYPVFVEYYPAVTQWRTPVAKELIRRLMIAEASIIIGNIRSKRALPLPEGGTTTFGGEALVTKGYEERQKVYEDALKLTEPPGIFPY
jgi:hypothetical protein